METKILPSPASKPLNVLLIGNNPIEMGKILEKINRTPGKRVITEIAFDLKSILERLINFRPNFILIDDNIGRAELTETVKVLSTNRKTKDTPITIIKNSNYRESSAFQGALDYVLKQHITSESLYNALKNSIKFRRTQLFLYKALKKRKGHLLRLVK